MRCDHCGFETDRPLKFCPRCGAGLAVPRNVPEKKKKAGRRVLLPVLLAAVFAAAFLLAFWLLSGGKDVFTEAEAGGASDRKEALLEESRDRIMETAQVTAATVQDGFLRGTVEIPCLGEYMLEICTELEEEGSTDEETYTDLFIQRLQKILSGTDVKKKKVEVTLSAAEAAEQIVTSAEYLETHDITDPGQYTLSQEEREKALKQKAVDQEIEWFEEQIWQEYPISEQELIPEIVQEGRE
jgi:hypothetical protein